MSVHRSTRLCSHPRFILLTLLIIVSLFNVGGLHPLIVQAASTATTATIPSSVASAQAVAQAEAPEPPAPPTVPIDMELSGRTAFTRTTRNADGSYTTTFAQRPLHWLDPHTNEWKE